MLLFPENHCIEKKKPRAQVVLVVFMICFLFFSYSCPLYLLPDVASAPRAGGRTASAEKRLKRVLDHELALLSRIFALSRVCHQVTVGERLAPDALSRNRKRELAQERRAHSAVVVSKSINLCWYFKKDS